MILFDRRCIFVLVFDCIEVRLVFVVMLCDREEF